MCVRMCMCMYALCMYYVQYVHTYVQIAFRPDVVGECSERFTMACDNCSVVDITVTGEDTSCSTHAVLFASLKVRTYVCVV